MITLNDSICTLTCIIYERSPAQAVDSSGKSCSFTATHFGFPSKNYDKVDAVSRELTKHIRIFSFYLRKKEVHRGYTSELLYLSLHIWCAKFLNWIGLIAGS